MPDIDRTRTVATLAIDSYDRRGELIGTTLHARCSAAAHDHQDVAEALWSSLPESWRQVTYAEALELFARPDESTTVRWTQLSIF